MNEKCVVCGRTRIDWPCVDTVTGFAFCYDCWQVVRNSVDERWMGDGDKLAAWLRTIADCREQAKQNLGRELDQEEIDQDPSVVEPPPPPAPPENIYEGEDRKASETEQARDSGHGAGMTRRRV